MSKETTLFYNGKIITLNSEKPLAEAMLVRKGIIAGIGDNDDFTQGDYEIINLEGKTVIPGFNDSHLHLVGIGEALETVDLLGTESFEELQTRLKNFIKKREIKAGTWIVGRGWNQNSFLEGKLPDKKLLDKVSLNNPIYLKRTCGHIAVANSLALEMAAINKHTSNPSGGEIEHDPVNGEPTGILKENALDLIESIIPKGDQRDIKRKIKNAASELVKSGLTSVQTDDFGSWQNFREIFPIYKELKENGELPLRVNLQIRMAVLEDFKKFVKETGFKTGSGDEFLEIGPCKILADGSLGGRTAALLAPYADEVGTQGVLLYEEDMLNEYINLAHDSGFQLAIHGIGDRAISIIINNYKNILMKEAEKSTINIKDAAKKLRPRIIHCQITNQELIKEIKALDIEVDIQPIFLNSDLHFAEIRLGKERIKKTYAWKTMNQLGIHLAGGSDGPVDCFYPLAGIYSAVTRKDLKGNPSEGWQKEEALDLLTAIKIYTLGSAYNSFAEDKKGSLEKGKYADFVILSEDLSKVNQNMIKDVQILATYVGGKEVYHI